MNFKLPSFSFTVQWCLITSFQRNICSCHSPWEKGPAWDQGYMENDIRSGARPHPLKHLFSLSLTLRINPEASILPWNRESHLGPGSLIAQSRLMTIWLSLHPALPSPPYLHRPMHSPSNLLTPTPVSSIHHSLLSALGWSQLDSAFWTTLQCNRKITLSSNPAPDPQHVTDKNFIDYGLLDNIS